MLFSIAGSDDLTMFEIQDAAKVITESVDPHARIIFGTVKDDKLKKGEVKITVIASNFPDGVVRKPNSLFQALPSEEERNKGKVFQPFGAGPKPEKVLDEAVIQNKKQPVVAAAEEGEDEWQAVPAFLRRSKLK